MVVNSSIVTINTIQLPKLCKEKFTNRTFIKKDIFELVLIEIELSSQTRINYTETCAKKSTYISVIFAAVDVKALWNIKIRVSSFQS